MANRNVLQVTADVYKAGALLLHREAETEGAGSAVTFADQLITVHDIAGLDELAVFWSQVWRYLMALEVSDTPVLVEILNEEDE